MAWTKRWFITQALEEIGYSVTIYDLSPEKLQQCLYRADTLLADWHADGISIGWPLPSTESSSALDQETNIADRAHQAVIANLAVRIAPTVGKTPSAETMRVANESKDRLSTKAALDYTRERTTNTNLPAGAGNKPHRTGTPFLASEEEAEVSTSPGDLEF